MISDEGSDSDVEILTESSNPVLNKSSDLPYKKFTEWKEANNKQSLTEEVFLDYFKELAQTMKPLTLWSQLTMLKPIIKANENVDMDTFHEVRNFLRTKSTEYKSKTSNIFTSQQIETFLDHAPDSRYLLEKVVIIFGILGACRNHELPFLPIDNIKDDGKMAQVTLSQSTCDPERTFVICDEFYKIYKKYRALRPKETNTRRFFLKYENGKCSDDVIGIHKVAAVPKTIAKFLLLPDAETYFAQINTFRKTATAFLAESSADWTPLQHLLGRNSEIVGEIIAEDMRNAVNISKQISKYFPPKPSTSSVSNGAAGGIGEPLFVACEDFANDQRKNDPGELSVDQGVSSTAEESNVRGQGSGKPSGGQRADKLVCLQWTDHHSNIQTSFPSFLNSEDFVDVTLACEGKSVKCHKVILSSCSEYLASLLRENPCQHPIILMKDLKFWEVEALVEFMYKAEVNIPKAKLPQLLKAAQALQVKGLASFAPVEVSKQRRKCSRIQSTVPPTVPQSPKPPATAPPKPPELRTPKPPAKPSTAAPTKPTEPETPEPPAKAPPTPQLSTKCAIERPIETQRSNTPPVVEKYSRERAPSPPPLRILSPEIKVESLDITTDIFAVTNVKSLNPEFDHFGTFNESLDNDPGGNNHPELGDAVQYQAEDMDEAQEQGDLLFDDFPEQERKFSEMDSGYSQIVPPDDDQHTHEQRRSNKKRKRKHNDRDIPRKRL